MDIKQLKLNFSRGLDYFKNYSAFIFGITPAHLRQKYTGLNSLSHISFIPGIIPAACLLLYPLFFNKGPPSVLLLITVTSCAYKLYCHIERSEISLVT